MKNSDIFKITIKEENSLESIDIQELQKLFNDIYLAIEKNDIIIYDHQTKTKLNILKFHSQNITSIHLCQKPFSIDNNQSISTNKEFFILSSSLDNKFAMHKISYENKLFKFALIAQCKPTIDEINGIIQVENGQFIVSTRDQHLFLFSKYINNKTFQILNKIEKQWQMEALRPFELKENIIGV